MSKFNKVPSSLCPATGKRSFQDEWDARKALGRAQASHARVRGAKIENRVYPCGDCDGFHLTEMSRRQHQNRQSSSVIWVDGVAEALALNEADHRDELVAA